ncbi:hypothetical protein EJB05_15739, partial [Eragrostis curvula]
MASIAIHNACTSSHRGNGGGKRDPFTGKVRPPGPLPTSTTLIVIGKDNMQSIGGEHFIITLWKDKYQIIKLPDQVSEQSYAYLGKSQKGVYCASLSYGWTRFQVWLHDESRGKIEWVLKSDINLQGMVENYPSYDYADRYNTPWIVNYEEGVSEAMIEDDSEWDFES